VIRRPVRSTARPQHRDVVVVGAGPAGLGVAAVLGALGIHDVEVLDRAGIGASFRAWPRGTRLITPSFPSNGFGAPDLNAITVDTAPSLSLQTEHPTGPQYAGYLEFVAEHHDIEVAAPVEVTDVSPERGGRLRVHTDDGDRVARAVVWAAGELPYVATTGIVGAEHAVHSSTVRAWEAVHGEHVVVVGGYESGVDAACHLVDLGRHVTVLDPDAPWRSLDTDPSLSLSPVTLERLRDALGTGRLALVDDARVEGIHTAEAGFTVAAADGRRSRPGSGPASTSSVTASRSTSTGSWSPRRPTSPPWCPGCTSRARCWSTVASASASSTSSASGSRWSPGA
jgi:putative flavoprotein involved in K+ transport